eukprot:CAMPEP_0204831836 /NCGR_PEP_ID=MMETSP1346-20131115/11859_1 /ASSEMBLY_ACC=CAM_ASM_000771 /TAXON_ID=215587 /ORGANISM="Aplanochytrium stocchinoi, Strain GSBS06" /LENGTH=222 /DNA_ID=CAMNT_0051963219 /DNA_START=351 /DNA_END=1020 /DNA_ORIENTATION=-
MAKKLYLYIALCVFLSALSIGAGTGDAELEPFKCAVEGILNCEGCEGGTVYYGVKFLSGTRQQLNFTEMTTLYPFAYKENATDSEPCNDDNFGDPLEEARKWCWCDLNPITTVTNTPTSVGVSVPTPKATVFCDECVRDTPSDELLSREEILKIILPTSLGVVFIVSLLLCPQKTVGITSVNSADHVADILNKLAFTLVVVGLAYAGADAYHQGKKDLLHII